MNRMHPQYDLWDAQREREAEESEEDEEEGMSHEGGRSLGKADLLVEGLLEKGLGGVVGKCKATGNTDDVLRPCSPKLFAHFTIEEAVEVSIVHLLGRMLCVVAT